MPRYSQNDRGLGSAPNQIPLYPYCGTGEHMSHPLQRLAQEGGQDWTPAIFWGKVRDVITWEHTSQGPGFTSLPNGGALPLDNFGARYLREGL